MRKRSRARSDISNHDRFGLTFLLTAIFHGIVILGVTFTFASPADSDSAPALDVILLQTQSPSEKKPADKQANYLAQISQRGGGDTSRKAHPRELFSAPTLATKPGLAIKTQQQEMRRQQQQSKQLALLHQRHSDYSIAQDNPASIPEKHSQTKPNQENVPLPAARPAAEISDTIDEHATRGKVKFINASTREFTAAKYMRNWIDRVERIGNLNYPNQARRQKLSGTLILDVTINADGKLIKTDIRQSSGHQVLDDAAKRIVELAAPFPPFTGKLRQQADVIHITRSWEFLNNNGLQTH